MFNQQEVACLRAALRFYAESGLDLADNRPVVIQSLATADGTVEALGSLDMAALWIKLDSLLKSQKDAMLAAIKACGDFDVGDFLQLFGESDAESEFVRAARKIFTGELEIDERAAVSKTGDGSGAWVSAWAFVSNEDAGIAPPSERLHTLLEKARNALKTMASQVQAGDHAGSRKVNRLEAYAYWLEDILLSPVADSLDEVADGQREAIDPTGIPAGLDVHPSTALNELVRIGARGEDDEHEWIRASVQRVGPLLDQAMLAMSATPAPRQRLASLH